MPTKVRVRGGPNPSDLKITIDGKEMKHLTRMAIHMTAEKLVVATFSVEAELDLRMEVDEIQKDGEGPPVQIVP